MIQEPRINLIEKLTAIIASSEVRVWHFHKKEEGPRFYYWLASEPGDDDGHGFETLEELIEAAYQHVVDPPERFSLLRPPPALHLSLGEPQGWEPQLKSSNPKGAACES